MIPCAELDVGAATASLSPPAISNLYSGDIQLHVTGLTNGETIMVEKYIDVNTNGAVNPIDLRMQSFVLTDNQANVIGGATNYSRPNDLNATGGVITASISQHATDTDRLVGRYIVRVSSPTGRFTATNVVFRITNSSLAQFVTGRARSSGTNVPYALIALLQPNGEGGLISGAVANSNGLFTIRIPAGQYQLVAVKRGFISNFDTAPVIIVPAGGSTSNNAVLTPAGRSISGRLVDAANTNIGISGVQLFISASNSLFTLAFTDVDGNFDAPVTAALWRVEPEEKSLGVLGYMSPGNDYMANTSAANVTGLLIPIARATALVYGSVLTPSNAPIAGIEVSPEIGESCGRALTVSAGRYALGVAGGTMWVGIYGQSLSALGYIGSRSTNLTLADGQAAQVDFTVRPVTAYLTGQIVDENGVPLSDVRLMASEHTGVYAYGTSGSNGVFSLGVVGGEWQLQLEGNDENPPPFAYPDASYAVSDGSGVSNIQYRVLRTTNQVNVLAQDRTATPVADLEIYAYATINGVNYTTSHGMTQSDGHALVNVAGGTWNVGVECYHAESRGYSCPGMQTATGNTNLLFTLQPMPTRLDFAGRGTNGQFQFQINGPPGNGFVVEVSSNLVNWSPFQTNMINPPFQISDGATNRTQRFYRTLLLGP